MMRLLRSGMLEVLDSEYVKLARVKGVVERQRGVASTRSRTRSSPW